jgi:hypothetical protein
MADQDVEETLKAEMKELTEIIQDICEKYHGFNDLPDDPWFLQSPNSATSILKDLLKRSSFDRKDFSKQAAKLVLKFKNLETNYNMSRASYIKESLDIEEALSVVKNIQISSTSAAIKVKKSQSHRGPLTVRVKQSNGKEFLLEETEDAACLLSLNENIVIEMFLDDGDKNDVIETHSLSVSEVINGTYYLSAMQKAEIKHEIRKKGVDYEVIMEIRLKLSVKERLQIFSKRNSELDKLINETNPDVIVYNDLMTSLGIFYNEHDQCFASLVRKRKDRASCCEDCSIF